MKVYKFILSALLTGLLCSCQKDVIKYNIPSETFEIEFDSNGGSQIDPQIVTYGSTVIKPSNPNLYAFWTFKILYDISYIDSKNDFNNNPSSYTGEKDIVLNDMQCREGYVFDGWLDEYGDSVSLVRRAA